MQAATHTGLLAPSAAPAYRVIIASVVTLTALLTLLPAPAPALEHVPLGNVRLEQVQTAIAERIERQLAARPSTASVASAASSETLTETSVDAVWLEAVAAFYRERDYAPAWLDNADVLHIGQLGALAAMHGLNPDDYDGPSLAAEISARSNERNVEELARLDQLASQQIARLAVHLAHGKIDPRGKQVRLQAPPPSETIAALLRTVAGGESLLPNLDNLAPRTPVYRQLRLALAQHRDLQSGGAIQVYIDDGKTLKPGMHDARVPALRARLGVAAAAGDLAADMSADAKAATLADDMLYDDKLHDDTLYDAALAAAVAEFQARHRLQPDGIVGPATRRELNVSLASRIDQLRVNLDWQRWLSTQAADDYLYINIPHFTLYKIEGGERVATMRTQVGKRSRQTPVLASTVDAIMANPSWTVPPTIFREDILPALRNDPGYLQERGMRVVDSRGRTVDSSHIDWRETSAESFPYRLRAGPGDDNALGRMKFLIPNPYLIYLHDTPSRHLFRVDNRAVSSGCIRVEDPEMLAGWLVRRQQKVSTERLQAALAADGTRYLGLDRPIPIVIAYTTVELDAEGGLVYAADVYGKDAAALAVLDGAAQGGRPLLLAAVR